MKKIESICICGGGSLGIVCAGVFLSKNKRVNILSGHPDKWGKHIMIYDPKGKVYTGLLQTVSSFPEDVIPGTDMVLLTVPGYLIKETLENIKPYVSKHTIVGSVVSSTGFFFDAHEVLENTQPLFGFQRVPFIARLREYGKTGDLLGYKNALSVAFENVDEPTKLAEEFSSLFLTPVHILNNYYEASLTNSNPILHTGRLYTMWKDFNGAPFSHQSKFYAEWTNEASEYLIKMDKEFQTLLRKLGIKEGVIPSLLDYYEVTDSESLTKKIKSIPAFQSIMSPMIETEKGWIPNFSSRYFTEDFPFGLYYIKKLAIENNIPTPIIDKVYNWGMNKVQTTNRNY